MSTFIDFVKSELPEIPPQFIDDFAIIVENEDLAPKRPYKNIMLLCNWMDVRKDNMKEFIVKNFEDKVDYKISTISRERGSKGGRPSENIFVTLTCFKEILMMYENDVSKQVRRYYLGMERILKKYHREITEKLLHQVKRLQNNQKAKNTKVGGYLYFFQVADAQEILESFPDIVDDEIDVLKMGKTKFSTTRLTNQNNVRGNNLQYLFTLTINENLDGVESCVKGILKKYQYRKNKEVYIISRKQMRDVIIECNKLNDKHNFGKILDCDCNEDEKKNVILKFARNEDEDDFFDEYDS